MTIVYTRVVTKDVRKIKDKKSVTKIMTLLEEMKGASSPDELLAVKKVVGHPTAYRIRIGAYRLGFYYEQEAIVLARLLKRSDIYKVFS